MKSLLLQSISNLLKGSFLKKTFVMATIFIVLVFAISSIAALVIFYPTLTGNSAQNQNNANTSLQKQFDVSIVYAYVGEMLNHTSYIGDNDVNMSLVSKYASSVILNSTRLPGVQVASCDGEIEVYKIQVTTDTNLTENFCYTIGTNYNLSFSPQELKALFNQTQNLFGVNNIVTMGGFPFNMTDNESLLSTTIGSYGAYSSGFSGQGLWSAGKPNAISVTVQRIGYLTISNGSVALHRDALNEATAVMVNLSNYGNGFLYNDLVPVSTLQTIDLFHPISSTYEPTPTQKPSASPTPISIPVDFTINGSSHVILTVNVDLNDGMNREEAILVAQQLFAYAHSNATYELKSAEDNEAGVWTVSLPWGAISPDGYQENHSHFFIATIDPASRTVEFSTCF